MNSRDDETNQSDRPETGSEFPFPSRTIVAKLEIPTFLSLLMAEPEVSSPDIPNIYEANKVYS